MVRAPLVFVPMLVIACGRIGFDTSSGDGNVVTRDDSATPIAEGGISTGGAGPTDGGGSTNSGGSIGIPEAGGDAGSNDAGGTSCAPGAPELCDGRDNDCDLVVDEGAPCPLNCVGQAWEGHGYMLCNATSYTWDEAKLECESAGLYLAKIESQAENDFVNDFVFASRRAEVWIGGSDLETEGDWRWTDGSPFWLGLASPSGVPVGGAFTQWYSPTEPDGQNGALNAPGNCLALSPAQNGAWLDQGCNYFRRALCRAPSRYVSP